MMNSIKRLLFFFLLSLPLLISAQHTLTINVENVATSEGYIAVGLFTSEETFLEDGEAFKGVFVAAEKGTTKVIFKDLPANVYAISLYHDCNGNKELDANIFGMPKEPLGFSIGKLKTFGPPRFEECAFDMSSDFEMRIAIK